MDTRRQPLEALSGASNQRKTLLVHPFIKHNDKNYLLETPRDLKRKTPLLELPNNFKKPKLFNENQGIRSGMKKFNDTGKFSSDIVKNNQSKVSHQSEFQSNDLTNLREEQSELAYESDIIATLNKKNYQQGFEKHVTNIKIGQANIKTNQSDSQTAHLDNQININYSKKQTVQKSDQNQHQSDNQTKIDNSEVTYQRIQESIKKNCENNDLTQIKSSENNNQSQSEVKICESETKCHHCCCRKDEEDCCKAVKVVFAPAMMPSIFGPVPGIPYIIKQSAKVAEKVRNYLSFS